MRKSCIITKIPCKLIIARGFIIVREYILLKKDVFADKTGKKTVFLKRKSSKFTQMFHVKLVPLNFYLKCFT